MDTLRLPSRSTAADPASDPLRSLVELLERRLAAGESLVVTIAEEDELLSPAAAAQRLGFSRQHVMRLIEAGELKADVLPGSRYRKIAISALVEFERRRGEASTASDAFSRRLDEVGAPLE